MVELQRERGVDAGALYADPRVRRLVDDGRLTLLESPWMPMDYQDRIEQPPHQMLNRATLHLRGGCTSILKTVVVTPTRGLGYCCGLTREQIPELNTAWTGGSIDDLLDAGSRDFMKIWLHIDGPERILAWAATKEPAIEWEDRYAHHCHSCLALFRDPLVRETIRNHHRERVDDVLARYVTRLRAEQRDHGPAVPATS